MRALLSLFLALLFVVPPAPALAQASPTVRLFLGAPEPTPEQKREIEEYQKGLVEVAELVDYLCKNIYPRPTLAECIDKVKHGVGQSADLHSEYLSKNDFAKFREQSSGKFGGLGLEIRKQTSGISAVLVVNTIEGTPAERAGILSGDLITTITEGNNPPVRTISLKGSDEAVALLRGEPGTAVKIRIARKGVEKELDIVIVREVITIVQVEGSLIVYGGKTYAFIKNKTFGEKNARDLEAKFEELKKKAGGKLSGLILSYENNAGGLLDEAYNNVRLFIETKKDVILTRDNNGISPYAPNPRNILHVIPTDITRGLPILAVVNSGSASASELVTKAFKHHRRALIAGTSETFGKGVVQSLRGRQDGSAIKLTTSEYLVGSVDDWVPVQCTGVVPDASRCACTSGRRSL